MDPRFNAVSVAAQALVAPRSVQVAPIMTVWRSVKVVGKRINVVGLARPALVALVVWVCLIVVIGVSDVTKMTA